MHPRSRAARAAVAFSWPVVLGSMLLLLLLPPSVAASSLSPQAPMPYLPYMRIDYAHSGGACIVPWSCKTVCREFAGGSDSAAVAAAAAAAAATNHTTAPSCDTFARDILCPKKRRMDIRGNGHVRAFLDVEFALGHANCTIDDTIVHAAFNSSHPPDISVQFAKLVPWLKRVPVVSISRVLLRDVPILMDWFPHHRLYIMTNHTHALVQTTRVELRTNLCFVLGIEAKENCLVTVRFVTIAADDSSLPVVRTMRPKTISRPWTPLPPVSTLSVVSTDRDIHIATMAILFDEPAFQTYASTFFELFDTFSWALLHSFASCSNSTRTLHLYVVTKDGPRSDAAWKKMHAFFTHHSVGMRNVTLDRLVLPENADEWLGYWNRVKVLRLQHNAGNMYRLMLPVWMRRQVDRRHSPLPRILVTMDMDTMLTGNVCAMWDEAEARVASNPHASFFVAPEPGEYAGYWFGNPMTRRAAEGIVYGVNTGVMVWNLERPVRPELWMEAVVDGLAGMADASSALSAMQWTFGMSDQNILNILLRNQYQESQLRSYLLPLAWNVPLGTVRPPFLLQHVSM